MSPLQVFLLSIFNDIKWQTLHGLFYTNFNYSTGVFLFTHFSKQKLFPDWHHQRVRACVSVHLTVWTELLWWMPLTCVYDRQTPCWSAACRPASVERPHRDSGDNKMISTSSSPLFKRIPNWKIKAKSKPQWLMWTVPLTFGQGHLNLIYF